MNEGSDHGGTQLHLACSMGNTEIVNSILQNGVDVNVLQDNRTPLMTACLNGKVEVVKELIKHGADINFSNQLGEHAMSIGCERSEEVVKVLLQNGVDPNESCKYNSPLIIAISKGQFGVVKLLVEHGAQVNKAKHLRYFSNVRFKLNYLRWPLLVAIQGGHIDIANYLLEHDSKIEFKNQPIHAACIKRSACATEKVCKLVEKLILGGTNFNSPRNERHSIFTRGKIVPETPLHIAVESNFAEVVWILVSFGGQRAVSATKENKTVWDLCSDNNTKAALYNKWSPQTHIKFPKVVRDAILSFLLVAKRCQWSFDTAIKHNIISFMTYGWLKEDVTK